MDLKWKIFIVGRINNMLKQKINYKPQETKKPHPVSFYTERPRT